MRRDETRLLDMLIAARQIREFTTGIDQATFVTHKLVQSGVMREIQVIGEAARQISDATKALYPRFPWAEIAGMRNKVIHEYFNIDLDILWDTIQNDIPALVAQLEAIVPPED